MESLLTKEAKVEAFQHPKSEIRFGFRQSSDEITTSIEIKSELLSKSK